MTRRNSFLIRWSAMLVVSLPVTRLVWAAGPEQVRLESLQEADAARMPGYTLKVTLEEPANVMLRDQGNSVTTCRITQGSAGFAASCIADKLPDPVFRPLGVFNYQSMDYDPDGNLGVAMRSRWLALKTKDTNETYEEQRSVLVNPKGVVVDSGVSRTVHRYSPDDQGAWSLSKLRRVWWALGHGLASDLVQVVGDVSESEGLHRMRVRGKLDGFPGGTWKIAVETSPPRLVREALFIRDMDLQPLVQVVTRGARKFTDVTLAEEGSVRFLIGNGDDAIETRVVLQDFQPRFDDQLLTEVTRTLENLGGQEVELLDYRSDPKKPTRTILRLPAQRGSGDK